MMRIICVGKKHEPWVVDGIERYQKRLTRNWRLEWVLLPQSSRDAVQARLEESQAIVSRLRPDEFVILLDERGNLLDSPALSRELVRQIDTSRPIVCIIGGAYGVSEQLQSRADLVWSLSPLVFPHQLVRLLLVEQLYRAQEIAAGHPYHHM